MVIVHSFKQTDGTYPIGPLLFASDGNLYGTTDIGGTNNQGTIFRLTTNGTFTSLYSFGGTNTDGANCWAA